MIVLSSGRFGGDLSPPRWRTPVVVVVVEGERHGWLGREFEKDARVGVIPRWCEDLTAFSVG